MITFQVRAKSMLNDPIWGLGKKHGAKGLNWSKYIILPPEILGPLASTDLSLQFYKIENQIIVSVFEFSAAQGQVLIPDSILKQLNIKEDGQLITIALLETPIPLGQEIILEDMENFSVNVSTHPLLIEQAIQTRYPLLSLNDIIYIPPYSLKVIGIKPANDGKTICNLNTDLTVIFNNVNTVTTSETKDETLPVERHPVVHINASLYDLHKSKLQRQQQQQQQQQEEVKKEEKEEEGEEKTKQVMMAEPALLDSNKNNNNMPSTGINLKEMHQLRQSRRPLTQEQQKDEPKDDVIQIPPLALEGKQPAINLKEMYQLRQARKPIIAVQDERKEKEDHKKEEEEEEIVKEEEIMETTNVIQNNSSNNSWLRDLHVQRHAALNQNQKNTKEE